MKTENKRRCYAAADALWKAAVFGIKIVIGLSAIALIPSLAVDAAEYRERKKARNK